MTVKKIVFTGFVGLMLATGFSMPSFAGDRHHGGHHGGHHGYTERKIIVVKNYGHGHGYDKHHHKHHKRHHDQYVSHSYHNYNGSRLIASIGLY